MASNTAAAFGRVPSTAGVLSDWVRSEALLVDVPVLVELVRVHEPLVAVVVVPVVARLPAFWADIRLDISITKRIDSVGIFKAPPCRFRQDLLREAVNRDPAGIAVLSRKAPHRARTALGVCSF